ncbi:unnamed protein product [Phaedon cochleariae]|uniref:Uncharacterized protein n=1 Tax=Phaedon cochleariae TaxID=80249 RepID=A0A9N9SLN5_PHACE|nr:unnamed protein product [Phaedon cochleariae]
MASMTNSITPCFNLKSLDETSLRKKVTFNISNTSDMENQPGDVQNPLELKNNCKSAISNPTTPQAHIEFSQELKKVINERNILTSKTRKTVFDALDQMKSQSEEESRNYKRERALFEIVNSEIKYVHQLEIILNFFMKPTKEQKLLRADDFHIMFGNIITIYNINKELLDELNLGIHNVTNAFSKISPFLKLYSVYAYDFKHILNILQDARSLNPNFAKFIENQESRPEVQNKLSALLITPIQRVPRYKLLLKQLQELTKPTEKEYDRLSDCLDKVTDAADHINKIVKDQENMQRILEIQRYLKSGEPIIVKPGRTLIKDGILVKMSTKNCPSEQLYTVLMNDIILFSKIKKELKVNSLKCLSIFPLGKCKIVEVLDKGCLKIICQEEELILYHEQFDETKNWIDKIQNAIKSHLSDRKTLRKDSSSRRPVKRKDLHEYHEIGISPGKPLKKLKMETELNFLGTDSKMPRKLFTNNFSSDHSNDMISNSQNKTDNDMAVKEVADLNHSDITEGTSKPNVSKEVFVFGRSRNSDFTFKIGEFLGGVGSSLKKIFGFKK